MQVYVIQAESVTQLEHAGCDIVVGCKDFEPTPLILSHIDTGTVGGLGIWIKGVWDVAIEQLFMNNS